MAGIGNDPADKIYNAFTGRTTWTAVAPYIGVYTGAAPADDGSGAGGWVSNFSDAYIQTTSGNWDTTAGDGTASYDTDFDFAATGATGTMAGIGFFNVDNPTPTEAQFMGSVALGTTKSAANGETVRIASNTMTIDLASGKTVGLHMMNTPLVDAVDAFCGKANWTAADRYIGLITTAPSDDDGTGVVEATGFVTDRLTMTNSNWAVPTDGVGSYDAALEFGTWSGADADIIGYGIWSAASTGTLLAYQAIVGAPKTITSGDSFTIPSGEITLDCQN